MSLFLDLESAFFLLAHDIKSRDAVRIVIIFILKEIFKRDFKFYTKLIKIFLSSYFFFQLRGFFQKYTSFSCTYLLIVITLFLLKKIIFFLALNTWFANLVRPYVFFITSKWFDNEWDK